MKTIRLPGTIWKDLALPAKMQWRIQTPGNKLWPQAYKTKRSAIVILAMMLVNKESI